ncbi:hypothetical protein HRG_006182 [Hirsutella rhossiliensis]|uniref:Uncharacterized protein n=1 Tax=Hirsutella rhossiliensis TaxID=111463 RepID=A0A9P8N2T7_9HYPO|nr:uncharacterized protein HRG_06182 [Hirsutella rhossiliensis]KAH0963672.1 hypothetical protein HRG_06182 [Hirsutella rhossiliensis]
MSSDEEPASGLAHSQLPTPDARLSAGKQVSPLSHDRFEFPQVNSMCSKDGDSSSRSTTVDSFVELLRSAVPTELIPRNLHCYMVRESNARLEMAKAAGVELGELSIGDDCLPTWPDLHWDPDTESLHAVIQNRLVDFQVSQDLGDLIREEIVIKGNLKLSQARELGVGIKNLSIGFNLLPTWDPAQSDVEDGPVVIIDDDESALDSEATASQADNFSVALPSDAILITPVTDVFDSHSLSTPRRSSLPSPSGSDCDSDDRDGGGDEFDDVITLENYVSALPVYEYGDAVNILHDVQLVGGPEGVSEVDLEVYLVEGDDDVADLSEVELAIDREVYECLFGDDEAIDIEIPGTELFCFNCVDEAVSDTDDLENHVSLQADSSLGLGLDELESLDHSEEATEDDDRGPTPVDSSLGLEVEDLESLDHSEEATDNDDDSEASQEGGDLGNDQHHHNEDELGNI